MVMMAPQMMVAPTQQAGGCTIRMQLTHSLKEQPVSTRERINKGLFLVSKFAFKFTVNRYQQGQM
jgi:hypothetical protein